MSDTNQFPTTGIARKILPTCDGYVVQKFEPDPGYRQEQELIDESGAEFATNGIDNRTMFDIEVMPIALASTATVKSLTTMVFKNVATLFPALAAFCGTDGSCTILIKGGVKPIGNPGEVMKLQFKGFVNTKYPAQVSGA